MTKIGNKIILVLAFILSVVLISIVVINFGKVSEENFDKNNTNNIIALNSQVRWSPINTFDYSSCMPPKFKVGERYMYNRRAHSREIESFSADKSGDVFISEPSNYEVEIYVDKIERINNTDYYVIKEKNGTVFENLDIKYKNGSLSDKTFKIPIKVGGCVVKINEKNLSLIIVQQKNTRCKGFDYFFIIFPESYLPACINENTHFVMGGKRTDKGPLNGLVSGLEFEVKGVEKVGGRGCFKLEVTEKEVYNNMQNIKDKYVFWIDREKRITIKAMHYSGNLLIEEFELKDTK
ncbi:MAG: hypothetical protein BWK75_04415 [Candidatus Altiarchaeales archaeon A3]|nr:MAG: hypothetical protein BWK75_04415 [Candidatus Altiarchaeales archaeon A3]